MKKTILINWAFVMLLVSSMNAQTLSPTIISSSGGFYIAGNSTISITIAEMSMVESFVQPNNILTQGFQQPELFTVSIPENDAILDKTSVYPNPSNGKFTISFNANYQGKYLVRIYSMIGQVVFKQSYETNPGLNSIKIDIGNLQQGIYVVEMNSICINNDKNISTYRINLVY